MTFPWAVGVDPSQTEHPDIASAKRVLDLEGNGIRAVAEALDESFVATLDILMSLSGRAVVSGMGKSGHVARKIAATLASTGTPAFFVHPGEASHGDLGMIAEGDAVIALSNSGETEELADTVAHCKRFAIPLIAMTGNADSALAKAADAVLALPAIAEACPMGLAPTTSTTAMLALGDAIAVALLERKGFSADDFHALHPGGKLGRRLLKVSDIMHAGDELPLTSADTLMSDAILIMTNKRFGCVGVVDDAGTMRGVITDGDLRRHMSDGIMDRKAGEVMTKGGKTIPPGMLASEALQIMNANAITTLFVMEGETPIGILHIHDCLRAGVA